MCTDMAPRIKELHQLVAPNQVVNKQDVKKDAWLAKGMLVLVKRKLSRGVKPRGQAFRELLAIVSLGETGDRKGLQICFTDAGSMCAIVNALTPARIHACTFIGRRQS